MFKTSNVWEDADILCVALEPFAQEGRLLSISSTGDNVLALLTLDPEEIVAIDLDPVKLYSLELRIAAFKLLNHDEVLKFLGVRESNNRMYTYELLRDQLSQEAAAFWDLHPKILVDGVIHGGQFEKKLQSFRRWILPLIHAQWKRKELLKERTPEQQEEFYYRYWDTWLWKSLYHFFFSHILKKKTNGITVLADQYLSQTRHILTKVPTSSNPYLSYFITGNYQESALPLYLRPECFEVIKARLDRIQLLEGPVQQASGNFDGFNLSNIFEQMRPGEFKACYEGILDRANRGARIAYWNMYSDYGLPRELDYQAQNLSELSRTLYIHDRVWFYRSFFVDEVTG